MAPWVPRMLYVAVGLVAAYFLVTRAFPKLIVTQAVYDDYYWPKAPWLFIHVLTGIVATLIGPYQFIGKFRRRYPVLHRSLGLLYVGSIVIASLTAVYLALVSGYNLMGRLSLGTVPLIWMATTAMAYIAVRRGHLSQHREWMVRSYVVTLFFVVFVMLDRLLPYAYFGTYAATMPLLTWVSWSIPLFCTELILQGRKM